MNTRKNTRISRYEENDMERTELAVQYKQSGFNCCQAVLLSFEKELGLPREQLIMMGAGFGAGMGTLKATCGALVGAVMVDNMLSGRKNSSGARKILGDFEATCGAVQCGDLKGVSTGRVLCPCDKCVENAVIAAEKNINS